MIDYANALRRAAERSRLRCVDLEQAIKWCRARISYLERHDQIIESAMRAFMRGLAEELDERATSEEIEDLMGPETLRLIARELRETVAELLFTELGAAVEQSSDAH